MGEAAELFWGHPHTWAHPWRHLTSLDASQNGIGEAGGLRIASAFGAAPALARPVGGPGPPQNRLVGAAGCVGPALQKLRDTQVLFWLCSPLCFPPPAGAPLIEYLPDMCSATVLKRN